MYALMNLGVILMTCVTCCQACTVNLCTPDREYCQHGGVCSMNSSTCVATCTCPPEYTGDRCQYSEQTDSGNSTGGLESNCSLNHCSLEFCLNKGTCSFNGITCSATCECPDGFSGSRCQTSTSPKTTTIAPMKCIFDPCTSSTFQYCENNGKCSLNSTTCMAYCICLDGYNGNRCENAISAGERGSITGDTTSCTFNPCKGIVNFCHNNGTCTLDSSTCVASCVCSSGYHGNRCDKNVTTATTTGKPTTTQSSRTCAFNACQWSSSFCDNNGTCKLDTTTCFAYCTCRDGYGGSRCEKETVKDISTVTTTTQTSKTCAFNPCQWATNFCQNNGTCKLNTMTCFAYCTCPDGYSGARCENKKNTEITTIATTTKSSRTCAFNPCQYTANFCQNNGTCKLNQTTCFAYCTCPDGYNGLRCENKKNTEITTIATTTKSSRTCAFNPCQYTANFCQNNGTCKLNPMTCFAYCTCPDGYSGSRCENNVNTEISTSKTTTQSSRTCAFNPCQWSASFCQNNGTCKLNHNTCMAYCACPDGFLGPRCAEKTVTDITKATTTTVPSKTCAFDVCSWSANFCRNNGTCSMDTRTCNAVCTCPPGFSGIRCDDTTEENKCQNKQNLCTMIFTSVCFNGATCVFNKTTCKEECLCTEGYTGEKCELETTIDDDPDNNDVYNVCRDNALERTLTERNCGSSANVQCVYGVCKASLTSNGAWTGYEYNCICDPGAQGPKCEHKCCLDCGPNGTCSIYTSAEENSPSGCTPNDQDCYAVCDCEIGFKGERCESRATDDNDDSDEGLETVTERSMDPAYNVCRDDALERTREERQCNIAGGIKCVYGVCRSTLSSNGRWTGYEYNCECDVGAQGTFCENKCCLDCGPNGDCHTYTPVAGNTTINCDCDLNYKGEFCDIFVPPPVQVKYEENTWYLWVVGICVVTFILLVMFAVVAPYVMWKHRVILIMKIVHYFQAYEDDDEKQWDAFVSYKADEADERFVVQVLYRKLEQEMGFKLCLHFRDFVPGETISNNIINAVEGSRRTILILTPRYIHSEFTRFEYEKAQEEMLKRKHRIIPIVLEDISECKSSMDQNLKGIIGSVTYLEWPNDDCKEKQTDKFWKRLQLSMPKKKVMESIPSEKSYESTKTDSTCVNSNIYSDGISCRQGQSDSSDLEFQEVYNEIGPIDESISPVIRPLSEKEELELANSSPRFSESTNSNLTNDKKYVTLLNVSENKENSGSLLETQGNLKNNIILSLEDMKLNMKNDLKSDDFVSIDLNEDSTNTGELIV